MGSDMVQGGTAHFDDVRSEYSHSEPILLCLCGCKKPVPPPKRYAKQDRKYATNACRARVRNRKLAAALAEVQGRQRDLPLDPEPQPVPQVVDQRVDLAECEKLRGDNALVLRRLRQGGATTYQLHEAAPRSMAIHSRVADVRAYLKPLGETVTRRRMGPRLHLYTIEAKR